MLLRRHQEERGRSRGGGDPLDGAAWIERDIERQDDRLGQVENAIKTFSRPSELKITDLRLAVVASNFDYPILRIDTNQGVYGLGEVRDAGHVENALQFKSLLLGQNPCNVDMIFRAIKQFGHWGREAGGVSTDFLGTDAYMKSGNIVAANPRVHAAMIEVLRRTLV